MNNRGDSDLERIIAISFGILIIFLFVSAGVFGTIINSFSTLGGFGIFVGLFLCLAIIIGIINAVLEK